MDGSSEEGSNTYFGGEVIKPNNNYIILKNFKSDRDTIYLNENNRFLFKIDNIKPGIYRFEHGGEYQTLVLEENDSVLFRLNTDDFDESLVYTGRGAKKNNFLIKSYLEDEQEDDKFVKHHQMEPEEFEEHILNREKEKRQRLKNFLSKAPQSELFEDIANSNIKYSFYAYREMYPFGHYGENKLVHYKDLPEDFYSYRKDVDYNDETLIELPAYRRFLLWHFNNIALSKFYKDGQHIKFDRRALEYNQEKLSLINETISNEVIKNYLLKSNTSGFLVNNDNPEASANLLTTYLKVASNPSDKEYIKRFYDNVERLKPGNPLPNAELYTFDRTQMDLRTIINKPTVIFCWLSRNKMHTRNSHYMARSLKARFPEIDFIAINATDNDFENWKRTVSKFDYPKENEFLFKNTEQAINNYVISYGHRVFIVDKKGIIFNANANLFSDEIQDQLETLLARSTK